ncbi:MAG: branched-chain amino acid aminotransferase [Myxococcales bacterium]|nr:branched-chain amino acid aminotransferase [Myxococcales bacterium]
MNSPSLVIDRRLASSPSGAPASGNGARNPEGQEAAPAKRQRPADHELGFGRVFTDNLFLADWTTQKGWHAARVAPYSALPFDPAAAVLHYGQALFEGFKIFRGVDNVLRAFRVDRHAARMASGAARLCMPAIDPEVFKAGMMALLDVDGSWVPSSPGTALYVRPTLVATEGFLGVRPAESYVFFHIFSPVGPYYAEGMGPVKIWIEQNYTRAAAGGLGAVKTGANYAASLLAASEAKKKGYTQVLWTDAKEHRWLEEVGTMNLFVQIGDEIITPPLGGSILAGVTRASVLEVLADYKLRAVERPVSVEELVEAHGKGTLKEVFGTGTAAVISPVGELGYGDKKLVVGDGQTGPLARRLYDDLTSMQYAQKPDRFGWLTKVG